MNCPVCGGDTKVVYTVSEPCYVLRERKCLKCGNKFYTSESQGDTVRIRRQMSSLQYKRRQDYQAEKGDWE